MGNLMLNYPVRVIGCFFNHLMRIKGLLSICYLVSGHCIAKKSGTVADKQAIASYVDKAFIVQSLDDNFNVRRAERFIAQIIEENIKPVLVFNKADLGCDRQSVEEQINHISIRYPYFLRAFITPKRFSGCGNP